MKRMPFNEAKYEVVIDQEPNYERDMGVENKKMNAPWIWECLKTSTLILIYFVPSVSLTFYQRWLLKDFHYPLSVVIIHLVVKFTLAVIIRELLSCTKVQPRKVLQWRQFLRTVAPTGVASGLDVGLSNWGLEYVHVSLYAMTKSTTIIFILICAIIFKLERKSWSLAIIVVMISLGLFLFTYKSTQFNTLGFCLLLLASAAAGIRWTCAQLLMQKSLTNPLDVIYHVQPWMIISLLPIAIASEGESFVQSCLTFNYKDYTLYLTIIKILIGAVLAFIMEFTEFLVVNYTSSLTLSVAGIFKEVLILVLAIVWNGDVITTINLIGLILCLGGISSHIIHKLRTLSKKADYRNGVHMYRTNNYGGDLKIPLINSEPEIVSNPSDAEESDSQIIFNILNRRDR